MMTKEQRACNYTVNLDDIMLGISIYECPVSSFAKRPIAFIEASSKKAATPVEAINRGWFRVWYLGDVERPKKQSRKDNIVVDYIKNNKNNAYFCRVRVPSWWR